MNMPSYDFNFVIKLFANNEKDISLHLRYYDLDQQAKIEDILKSYSKPVNLSIYPRYEKFPTSIINAIKINTNAKINTLSLTNIRMGETGDIEMAELLKINSSITSLDLSGCDFYYNYAQHIMESLKINNTLKRLNLRGINIHDKGIINIIDMLKSNCSITYLNLGSIVIGYELINEILKTVQTSKNIKILYLNDNNSDINNYTDNVTDEIVNTIISNDSLKFLDLSKNNLRYDSIIKIAESLSKNECLTTVDLSDNLSLSDNETKNIIKALQNNFSLTDIQLPIHNNNTEIINVMIRNRQLLENRRFVNTKCVEH